MYTHTKPYGLDILPPEEIRGKGLIAIFVLLPLLIALQSGEYTEGLKHFTVSDVKFHPQRYVQVPDLSTL